MGVAIPQVVTEDRAGNALVIDGGLRFNGTNQYLTRTFSTPTSSTLYTFSFWVKRSLITSSTDYRGVISATNAGDNYGYIDFSDNGIRWANRPPSGTIGVFQTTPVYRDASAWYHMCLVYDSAQSTDTNKVKLYANNTQVTAFGTFTAPSSSQSSVINSAITHYIGYDSGNNGYFSGLLSQVYLIDGQALDPSYFGYTDPLTNTWRPKKLSSSIAFGTNGFYLPLDGNTPIGQDMSGKGNNWTPVNFGGSNTIEKATGALPILNTDGGGKVARVGVRTDSNSSSLVLALPFVGIKSDFSNAVNSGTSNKAVTNNNGVSFVSTVSNFYGGSASFTSASSQYLTVSASSDFNFGTSDWTMEAYVYMNSTASSMSLTDYSTQDSATSPYGQWYYSSSNGFMWYHSSTNYAQIATSKITANRWFHLALVKSSGTLKHYLDGVEQASQAHSVTNTGNSSLNFLIGQQGNSTYWNGYIQDFRIYKGLAKYTQNFIPASTDPDILPDTPSGVAYSSNVALVPSTDGAVAFDGSGDWLSLPTSSDFSCSSGTNFTFEAFIYPTSVSDTTPFGIGNNAGFAYRIISGSPYLYVAATGGILNTGTIATNKWTHIAVTRNSGTLYSFIDGVLVGSVANSGSFDGTQQNFIGAANLTGAGSPGYTFTGQISNTHWVNGTALYTSNFTPPTAPITPVANTKLLCCQENKFPVVGYTTSTATGALPILNTNPTGTTTTGGVASDSSSSTIVLALSLLNNSSDSSATIKGSGSAKTFTATGNAAASSTQSKYYGGSFYFDGSGDSLTTTTSTDFAIKQSDFTIEMWVYPTTAKDGNVLLSLGTGMSALYWTFGINASNGFYFGSGTGAWQWETNGDPGTTKTSNGLVPLNTWTHIAAVRSGTSLLYFCNGLLVKTITSFPFGSATQGGTFYVGTYFADANNDGSWYQGYIQDLRIYKGTAKYTTNFNPVGNFDRPSAAVSPSQILPFGNTTATTLNPFTTNINTQRGKQSGYCTLNPLHKHSSTTLANGNLDITASDGSVWYKVLGTVGVSTGKWYWESGNERVGGSGSGLLGIAPDNAPVTNYVGYESNSYAYYNDNGSKYSNATGSSYGSTFTTGDVIGVALDMNIGTLTFYKNGVSQGTAFSGITGTYCPAFSSQVNYKFYTNFGQKPFKFPPPAGFQPLALANTPRPTIVRPDQYVGIVTYTGNDSNPRSFANLGWKPDFIWIKNRSQSYNHVLFDSVRGAGGSKVLFSNRTTAEGGGAGEEGTAYGHISSFDNYGFTVNTGTTSDIWVNNNTENYVAWAWKAGGNSNTYNINDIGYSTASAAGLTAGTITPTGASVNTKSGFSIITYTGPNDTNAHSFSHGLGKKPSFIIIKNRDRAFNWDIYHSSLGYNSSLIFTSAATRSGAYSAEPDSTIVNVQWNYTTYQNDRYVAYCWAEIPGFSKFGSFSGNNSADGVYVSLGFRPKFLIVKCTQDITGDVEQWIIRDSTRSTYNPANANLYANLSNAEDDASGFSGSLDLLSNGFKMRGTYGGINASATYIYAAWAETPSFNLYGGQANAR